MGILFLILLIGLPIMEIAVFIEAGERIGLWPTIGAIFATAVIGLAIIRFQGLGVLERARRALAQEQFPGLELFDGLCLLVAGALLITPGFVTDTLGFLLLIVPLRRLTGALAWRHMQARGFVVRGEGQGAGAAGVVIDGEYDDVTQNRPGPTPGRHIEGPQQSDPPKTNPGETDRNRR
ncbi:MAG: FxsA family protein [Rhodospirillaceae bacterium]